MRHYSLHTAYDLAHVKHRVKMSSHLEDNSVENETYHGQDNCDPDCEAVLSFPTVE